MPAGTVRLARRCFAKVLACGGFVVACTAAAQGREFPPDTRFGVLEMIVFPSARLDGNPATLAPGARIRGESNALVLPQQVSGARAVRYRTDFLGQLRDIWLLTGQETEEARIGAAGNSAAESGVTKRNGENTR